jgi:hypothetical protein
MLKRGTCLHIKRRTEAGATSEFEIGSSLLLCLLIWVVVIVLLVRGFDPSALLRTLLPAVTGTVLK